MLKRRTLLSLQVVYLLLALGYLSASYIQLKSGGPQFSKAAPLPNIALFLGYGACLLFGLYRKDMLYRLAMAAAVLMFGFGGVLMNIVHYLQSGLEGFSSFPAFAVGVGINAFGLVWNIVAAIGAYQR